MDSPTRTLVVWCPDWPVVAAGCSADVPVAVVEANRVVACSAAARAAGVRRGLRRREAQGRCPDVEIVAHDPSRDARAWEPVVAAVATFTPGVEIVRPGVAAIGTRGPSRYFGGDRALAGRVAAAVDAVLAGGGGTTGAGAGPRCRVGVADGRFAAEQAARAAPAPAEPAEPRSATAQSAAADSPQRAGRAARARATRPQSATADSPDQTSAQSAAADSTHRAGRAAPVAPAQATRPQSATADSGQILVVPPGGSAAFLAPLPVTLLPFDDLTARFGRLGLRTLGQLAELPAPAVLARFGPEGETAHRLARGLDDRPLLARTPPADLAVSTELDPPAERVEVAAFVAKALADQLHAGLAAAGLACTRVAIEAETEHGETLVRLWRHAGALTAGAVAERVRWQLDGWLASGATTAGITKLRLAPDEVRPDLGRQLGFWGAAGDEAGIARTLTRLQGILGPDGVVTAVLGGGRDPSAQVRLVPWGDAREPTRPGPPPVALSPDLPAPRRGTRAPEVPPWPGRLPGPAPAIVHAPALAATVRDRQGQPVAVSGRGMLSAAPAEVAVAGGPWLAVEAWTGPWPLEERWWEGGRRRARFQVAVAGGAAYLLVRESGEWRVEATYD
ncbi:MAG TPA: hypothetical protein VKV06_06370 [Acidimicrobiales bacterium]|nr:hypothetical protein [Acidimicrobiales bacterium]